MNFSKSFIIFIFFSFCGSWGYSQNFPIELEQGEYLISEGLYLVNKDNALSFENVRKLPDSTWQVFNSSNPGFKKETADYWVKFSLKNTSLVHISWLIDFENWSKVQLFENGEEPKISGHHIPYRKRDYPEADKVYFHAQLIPQQTHTYFAKITAKRDHRIFPRNLNFKVIEKEHQDLKNGRKAQLISVFIGVFFFMFLYNLFVYFSTRENSYLFYLAILVCNIYMTLGNAGYTLSVFSFWEDFYLLRGFLESIGSSLTVVFMFLFTIRLLKMKTTLPILYKILVGFIWFIVVLTIGGNVAWDYFMIPIYLSMMMVPILLLTIGIVAVIKKLPSSGYFLVAYSFVIIGLGTMALCLLGVLPNNMYTIDFSMPTGYIFEMLFFSFALANQINLLKKENAEKNEHIIRQLRENEKLQTQVNRELEQKVAERTIQIRAEKQKSDDLLLNILPEETAEELKRDGSAKPRSYDSVSVLFTDFKGFTQISETMEPAELVQNLHSCFVSFDEIISKHNLEKIKTIGDAYMCAGGVPTPNDTHAFNLVSAALEMLDFLAEWNAKKIANGEVPWEMRIGIHTGPITAGVVGKNKFAYDIWGDAVNLASRMESSGEPGKLNVSEKTWNLVKDHFTGKSRGKIEAKNKGEVEMYFVSWKHENQLDLTNLST